MSPEPELNLSKRKINFNHKVKPCDLATQQRTHHHWFGYRRLEWLESMCLQHLFFHSFMKHGFVWGVSAINQGFENAVTSEVRWRNVTWAIRTKRHLEGRVRPHRHAELRAVCICKNIAGVCKVKAMQPLQSWWLAVEGKVTSVWAEWDCGRGGQRTLSLIQSDITIRPG